jgi:AcrR family transcriptional regulator
MVDPRVARSREAVLRAGVELISEGGLGAFSVDAVAARSGVAKTTIYRHWPGRRDLLNDVFESFDAHTPTPDTGSLRDDLLFLSRDLAADLAGADWPKRMAVIVGEAEHDKDLATADAAHVRNEMTPIRVVLERAVDRGDLPPGTDVELVAEHLVGALFFRRLVLHGTSTPDEADRLVDLALGGLIPRTETP